MYPQTPSGLLKKLIQLTTASIYSKVIFSAIELDIFAQLKTPKSSDKLSKTMGWHTTNTHHVLNALFSIGFLEKRNDEYQNTPEVNRYLVKESPEYIGGHLTLLGSNQDFNQIDIKSSLENGPTQIQEKKSSLDFEHYIDGMRKSQSGYRQQEILSIVTALPEYPQMNKILDLGCATGLLGLSIIQSNPNMTGVLYDLPPMRSAIEEAIQEYGLEKRAFPMSGDYTQDDIGNGYDMIIAVGTFGFAKEKLDYLMKKLYLALNDGGVLVNLSEGVLPDSSSPSDIILGWLPYSLQGIDMIVEKGLISNAALKSGFSSVEKTTHLMSMGTIDLDIIRK